MIFSARGFLMNLTEFFNTASLALDTWVSSIKENGDNTNMQALHACIS